MSNGEGDWSAFHNNLLEVLRETSPESPLQKKRILELLKTRYGLEPSRTTLDKKLDELENLGYGIISAGPKRGFYLEKTADSLSDGELRYLIDDIMYSRNIPEYESAEIIRKLARLGSGAFEKEMNKRAVSAQSINKDASWTALENIELLQKAIFSNKRISANYIVSFDRPVVHGFEEPVVIDPRELAFSNGRYYLLCSFAGSEKLDVLRVDRLDCVTILNESRAENQTLERIGKGGGLQQYLYSQPELRGGEPMDFDLYCYCDSVEEVYDIFGKQNTRIKAVVPENYDDSDAKLVAVRSTREAMKSWAILRADSIVVVNPKEFRDEIAEAISQAAHTYDKTGRPAPQRAFRAQSFGEFLREGRLSGGSPIFYRGRGKDREPEPIDISEYDLGGLTELRLQNCRVFRGDKDKVYPGIKAASFFGCVFDTDIFESFPALTSLTIVESAITDLGFLGKLAGLDRLRVYYCENVSDISPVFGLKELRSFETDIQIFDEAAAEKLRAALPECGIKVEDGKGREHRAFSGIRTFFYIKDGKVVSRDVRYAPSFGWRSEKNVPELHKAVKAIIDGARPLETNGTGTLALGGKLRPSALRLDGRALEDVLDSSAISEAGSNGEPVGGVYGGERFPAEPKTLFYDYIYVKAVRQSLSAEEISAISEHNVFTDRLFYAPRETYSPARGAAIVKLLLDICGEIPDMTAAEFEKFHRERVLA